VCDPDGALFALVVLNLDMGQAFDQAAAFHDGTGALYIADKGGDFLRHPKSGAAFGRELGSPFGLADAFPEQARRIAAVAPEQGAFLPLADVEGGQTAYVTARRWDPREPDRRLLFVMAEHTEHLIAQVGLLRRDSLLGVGGLLLLAVLLVLITVRRETRSLSALARASEALARGDYRAPLPATGGSEVGSLVRAFRHMAFEVERREGELAELNRDLERRVQERTRALSRQHELQRLILESTADGGRRRRPEGSFSAVEPQRRADRRLRTRAGAPGALVLPFRGVPGRVGGSRPRRRAAPGESHPRRAHSRRGAVPAAPQPQRGALDPDHRPAPA
jgi:HAMP domain-containing protein